MKYAFSLAALFSVVLGDAGFVQLPLTSERVNRTSIPKIHAEARSKAIPEVLKNNVLQYFVSINLGTPGQTQVVSIDTGSSDLWVYGPGQGAQTSYDYSKSSTSQYINDGFSIEYVDGSGASGNYYTDDSSWGGAKVNFQFAVSDEQTEGGRGVFGIAQVADEASEYGTYANYPVALKQQGIIESTAYSLYLDDINTSTGSLLFGGVDSSKYSGQLYTVPITSSSSFSVNFEVNGNRLNGVLDAGTSLTYLPEDVVEGLAKLFGATWNDYNAEFGPGYYTSEVPSSGSLTYNFSGSKVAVDISELFLSAGQGQYLFTILPNTQSNYHNLLGDTFLRSAYVVYDIDSSQIAIAQASYSGSSSSSIKAITSSGIPGAKPAPGF